VDYAQALYDELAPWQHMMVWNTAVAYNSFHHYLGGLAATLGDHDSAVRHFERAVATAERIPAPLWLARTLHWYGQLLVESGDPAEAARGREALQRSVALAHEHGARLVEREAGDLLTTGVAH
jgi:hypothetical protein